MLLFAVFLSFFGQEQAKVDAGGWKENQVSLGPETQHPVDINQVVIHPVSTLSAWTFEFANWIPEAIRAVTIRITNLAPPFGGLEIFFILLIVRLVQPLYQRTDFPTTPDFVGFLFRLHPF